MPVDKNEAPEGCFAVENNKSLTIRGNCQKCYFFSVACPEVGCTSTQRIDRTSVYFVKKESEKTMEEYEYMTADSAENCHKILDWSFSPGVEIKIGAEWSDHFDGVRKVYKYRRKTPTPSKVKKLVNRDQEDFWPLIGRYWAKDSAGRRYLILNDTWHGSAIQECWQIAPLGTEEWQPMQKEIEVEV